MPLGSSSAAPVMRPGPSRLVRPWSSSRMGVFAPASFERTVFAVVAFLAVGMAGDCPRAGRADHRRHERTAAPSSGRRIEEAVDRLDHDRALAHAGGDPLDGARANVADGVDTGTRR